MCVFMFLVMIARWGKRVPAKEKARWTKSGQSLILLGTFSGHGVKAPENGNTLANQYKAKTYVGCKLLPFS